MRSGNSNAARSSCEGMTPNQPLQLTAMNDSNIDKVFAGSIPKVYETYLVPLIFKPYARDLVNRLKSRSLARVLEIAAGTGVVTRNLASVLPESVSIVATDLNQPMLDLASTVGTKRPVEWRLADAMQLPFEDETFDAVVCQFGVMFFPDKAKAFSEVRRILRSGGRFHFQRVGSNRGERVCRHHDQGTRIHISQGPASLHGSRSSRLFRPPDHRAGPPKRRACRATPVHDGHCTQSGNISSGPGHCVLSRDTATKRNRGTRPLAARRSDQPRLSGYCPSVRLRGCGRQDSGTHYRHREVTAVRSENIAL